MSDTPPHPDGGGFPDDRIGRKRKYGDEDKAVLEADYVRLIERRDALVYEGVNPDDLIVPLPPHPDGETRPDEWLMPHLRRQDLIVNEDGLVIRSVLHIGDAQVDLELTEQQTDSLQDVLESVAALQEAYNRTARERDLANGEIGIRQRALDSLMEHNGWLADENTKITEAYNRTKAELDEAREVAASVVRTMQSMELERRRLAAEQPPMCAVDADGQCHFKNQANGIFDAYKTATTERDSAIAERDSLLQLRTAAEAMVAFWRLRAERSVEYAEARLAAERRLAAAVDALTQEDRDG